MGNQSAIVDGETVDGAKRQSGKNTAARNAKSTASETTAAAEGGAATTGTIADITILNGEEGQKSSAVVPGVVAPDFSKPPKRGANRKREVPKGTNSGKKQTGDTAASAALISGTLKTVTEMAALRAGNHWAFTQEECEKIAQPAAALLERYDLASAIGKYGDWGALIMALGAAAMPRVMIEVMNKPARPKKGATNNVQSIQPKQQQAAAANADAGASGANGGNDHRKPTEYGTSALKQLLTPIVG